MWPARWIGRAAWIAVAIGAAASKGVPITVDTVQYYNRIVGFTMSDPLPSWGDLETMAAGAGIKRTCTVAAEGDIAEGARMIREGNGTSFVLLRVRPTEPAPFQRNFDASLMRDRFKATLQSGT